MLKEQLKNIISLFPKFDTIILGNSDSGIIFYCFAMKYTTIFVYLIKDLKIKFEGFHTLNEEFLNIKDLEKEINIKISEDNIVMSDSNLSIKIPSIAPSDDEISLCNKYETVILAENTINQINIIRVEKESAVIEISTEIDLKDSDIDRVCSFAIKKSSSVVFASDGKQLSISTESKKFRTSLNQSISKCKTSFSIEIDPKIFNQILSSFKTSKITIAKDKEEPLILELDDEKQKMFCIISQLTGDEE